MVLAAGADAAAQATHGGAPLALPSLDRLAWRPDFDMAPMFQERLAVPEAMCTSIVGLVASGDLHLALGLAVFEAKVEGALSASRWLWGASPGILEDLSKAYARWAKALLGGSPWRNSGVALREVGWELGGGERAVMDICRRRAR